MKHNKNKIKWSLIIIMSLLIIIFIVIKTTKENFSITNSGSNYLITPPYTGNLYYSYIIGDGTGHYTAPAKAILTVTPYLDSISTKGKSSLTGAYALILLTNTYTGPVVNIRRSSDNSTQDFHADSFGNIYGLSNWLNGSQAFVTKWYDQSGLGNHAVQTSAIAQPVLVPASSQYAPSQYLIDSSIRPNTMFFNITGSVVPTGLNAPYTFIVRHGSISNTNAGAFICAGTININNEANSLRANFGQGTAYDNWWWNNDFPFGLESTLTQGNRVAVTFNGLIRTGLINNVVIDTNTTAGSNTLAGPQYLFTDLGQDNLNGQMAYMLVFNSALSTSDLNILSTM